MTSSGDRHTIVAEMGWIDRAVWGVGLALAVAMAGFVAFYLRDRYLHPSETMVERQTGLLEELVLENPSDPDLRVNVAAQYLEGGLAEQAIVQGEEALKLEPEHMGALILLGQAYAAVGDIDQAIARLEQAERLNRDSEFALIDTRMNVVYYELGELYRVRGEDERALTMLRSALKVDPGDADARYSLALTYQALGDHEAAVDEFHQALRYVPDFAEAYEGLALSYRALGMLDEAAYADAMVAFCSGDYRSAAERLESVVRDAPGFSPALLGLGLAYEKLGREAEAAALLREYLDTDPHSVVARHALGRLSVEP